MVKPIQMCLDSKNENLYVKNDQKQSIFDADLNVVHGNVQYNIGLARNFWVSKN